MAPESPGIVCALVESFHRGVSFLRIETNFEAPGGFAATPDNPYDAVFDIAGNSPFLDAHGHCS